MLEGADRVRWGNTLESLGQLPVEQLRCHRIDSGVRRAVVIPREELADLRDDGSDEIWLDIQASHPSTFEAFLDRLELHPLILEDCLDPQRSPRFSSYENSLHFEVPVLSHDQNDEYLSVICAPRLLVTIRTSPIPEVDRWSEDNDQHVQLNEGTKSALLYAILDALTDRLVVAATETRDEIRQLSRLMDAHAGRVDVEQIIGVRRRVQDITTVAEDQLYCVSSLVAVDSSAFPMSKQRDYFRDATRNYEAALRVLHRYEARAAELYQQYTSSLQSKTEARLRTLTILSSICMPLTLIAGVYGMNFARMPELKSPLGYPITLILMLAVAIGQLLFFYKRGWFR